MAPKNAKRGLGKGIDSLIPAKVTPSKAKETKEVEAPVEGQVTKVKITKIEPNRKQPRKTFDEDKLLELADSIKQYGIIEPLTVVDRGEHYEIVGGERRWRAAQKLGLNQVTYAEEILKIEDGKATIRRHIDGGVETVEAPLPVVITVNGSAAPCRPANAKLVMKFKRATCPMERPQEGTAYDYLYEERPYLTLNQWSVADVDGDANQCGLAGSPTKVKAVKNIVFQAKESKTLTASDADVEGMIKELLEEKIIG